MFSSATKLQQRLRLLPVKLVIWRCRFALLAGETEATFKRLPKGSGGQFSPTLIDLLAQNNFSQPRASQSRSTKHYAITVASMFE